MELEQLIQSIDIVEFISRFADLELKGGEWWCLSPFTEEKTPSFSVRREEGKFYDFSSGIGGNVLTFVKYYYKVSAPKAVEILKEYAGFDGEITEPKKKLDASLVCKKFAKPTVPSHKTSIATELPDDYMDKYQRDMSKLKVWMDEGISKEVLDEFQVRYDSFSNRIVYPIRNLEGKIVNVGGRTLDSDWKEKKLKKYCYFFSWGTISTIYGLAENMKSIKDKKEVILFEGCKSVLLAKTWGIDNAGAILTSHLSANQMNLLVKLGCRVVFALDNEVDVRADRNIARLKRFCNVSFIKDMYGILSEKDSPVDKGEEVFRQLYGNRYYYH